MASASTYHPPFTTHQLLVSVQNADEALAAFQCEVPWVDLKNPADGSLGQPSRQTCAEFLEVAARYPTARISVALGELSAVDWQSARQWLHQFEVGKVGLAGQAVDATTLATLAPFKGKIVPALYADWQSVQAPPPAAIFDLALAIEAPFLLVDTCIKDGRSLFDWMSVAELQQLQLLARNHAIGLVVAGSLRIDDWLRLEQLEQATIGVRGAVCEASANRTSRLSPPAIRQWLSWTRRPLASPPK